MLLDRLRYGLISPTIWIRLDVWCSVHCMKATVTTRLRWAFAVAMPIAAAAAYLLYMGNGMAAGDMMGIAGQEHNIATAQRNAGVWFTLYWTLQLGVVASTFLVLRIGNDATAVARYVGRGFAALVLAFPLTLSAGLILVVALDFVRHLR